MYYIKLRIKTYSQESATQVASSRCKTMWLQLLVSLMVLPNPLLANPEDCKPVWGSAEVAGYKIRGYSVPTTPIKPGQLNCTILGKGAPCCCRKCIHHCGSQTAHWKNKIWNNCKEALIKYIFNCIDLNRYYVFNELEISFGDGSDAEETNRNIRLFKIDMNRLDIPTNVKNTMFLHQKMTSCPRCKLLLKDLCKISVSYTHLRAHET